MSESIIKIYGVFWCGDCRRAKKYFDQNNIDYEWINIDINKSGAEYVKQINRGKRIIPTIVFQDGSILVEPSNLELEQKLSDSIRFEKQ